MCWGYNYHGQLGIGSTSNVRSNMQLVNLGDGELGFGFKLRQSFIQIMQASDTVRTSGGQALFIATGANHTCALRENEDVVCWGRNKEGQLNVGNMEDVGALPGQMGNSLKPALRASPG
jgi:hypothetical protein